MSLVLLMRIGGLVEAAPFTTMVTTLAATLFGPNDARRGRKVLRRDGQGRDSRGGRFCMSEAAGTLGGFLGSGPVRGFSCGRASNIQLTAAAPRCRVEAPCYSCTGTL